MSFLPMTVLWGNKVSIIGCRYPVFISCKLMTVYTLHSAVQELSSGTQSICKTF